MTQINSSDASGWLEAVATAIVAPGTLLVIGLQVVDRFRQNEDRRRAQAAKVRLSEPRWSGGRASGPTQEATVQFDVINASEDVIGDVEVLMAYTFLDTDGKADISHETARRGRIDPTNVFEATTRLFRPREGTWSHATASVQFTDAAGNRWLRDAGHRLYFRGRTGDPRSELGLWATITRAVTEYRERRRPY